MIDLIVFITFSLTSPYPPPFPPTQLCVLIWFINVSSPVCFAHISLNVCYPLSMADLYQVTHLSLRSMSPRFDYMSHLGCFCHVLLKPTRLNNKCIADRPVGGSMGSAYIHVHME